MCVQEDLVKGDDKHSCTNSHASFSKHIHNDLTDSSMRRLGADLFVLTTDGCCNKMWYHLTDLAVCYSYEQPFQGHHYTPLVRNPLVQKGDRRWIMQCYYKIMYLHTICLCL